MSIETVHALLTQVPRSRFGLIFSACRPLLALAIAMFLLRSNHCEAGDEDVRPTIVISFTSFREDMRYANVYRYELSPDGEGKITGKVTPGPKRSDHHPSLSHDGQTAIFAGEVVGQVNQIHFWKFADSSMSPLPSLNVTTTAQMAPSFCSESHLVAFEAWKRPGSSGRWDILLYDVERKAYVPVPGLNSDRFDERKPAFSHDGRWLGFTTNEFMKSSLTDIRLYDRQTEQVIDPLGLNSTAMDTEPSLSRDGRLLTFISDRPGGEGARDVYLYDAREKRLLALPGLNSLGQEQSPSISADGRFIAFVSERLDATGERDVFVYDRQTQTLVPTPDLNCPGDDYDPCIVLKPMASE